MSKQIIFKILTSILVLLTISGCSTYPNKFKCGDARGLGCTMLHEVDKQIDSGQIDEAYKDKNKDKNCHGTNCFAAPIEEGLSLRKRDQATSHQDESDESLDDANNLHF